MPCLSAFELYSRWVPLFDGATALPAQTNKAERHVEDHADYAWRKSLLAAVSFKRLLGNGRLGSPK